MKLEFFLTDFRKILKCQIFMTILPIGDELFHADRRTASHDESYSRFPQFSKAPKSAYWQKAELYCSLYNSKPLLKTDVNHLKWLCIIRKDSIRTPQQKKTCVLPYEIPVRYSLYSESIADYLRTKRNPNCSMRTKYRVLMLILAVNLLTTGHC
jgi:hypothetical protein